MGDSHRRDARTYQIYHGLDSEYVPWLHNTNRLVLGVVRNIRRAVEQLANAVAAIGTCHRQAVVRGETSDDIADLSVRDSQLAIEGGGDVMMSSIMCYVPRDTWCRV